jgi:hypothetical protein
MKTTDRKAVRLVVGGRVVVDAATFDGDNRLTTAAGTVYGDTGVNKVKITPDGSECGCAYGQHTSNGIHSHDQALRLAAQRQKAGTA